MPFFVVFLGALVGILGALHLSQNFFLPIRLFMISPILQRRQHPLQLPLLLNQINHQIMRILRFLLLLPILLRLLLILLLRLLNLLLYPINLLLKISIPHHLIQVSLRVLQVLLDHSDLCLQVGFVRLEQSDFIVQFDDFVCCGDSAELDFEFVNCFLVSVDLGLGLLELFVLGFEVVVVVGAPVPMRRYELFGC